MFDVAVVGAGPSGSLSAYRLAREGVRVAIFDAKEFPREKACGGGLQQRATARIPCEWQSTVRGALRNVDFSYGLSDRFSRSYPETLVYGVLRSEFDQHLLEAAMRAGARFHGGVRTERVESGANGALVLRASSGDFRARFVLGADGANSVVNQALNSRDSYFWQAAIYCEIPRELTNNGRIDPSAMRIDWGSLPSGYAWVFPKRGSVNVGVGGPVSVGRMLRPYLRHFLIAEGLLSAGALDKLRFTGHKLPTLTKNTRLAGERILLVGDAAGLVEPLTGEGISYACHSAELASRAVLDCLRGNAENLSAYADAVREEIGRDIFWARRILSYGVVFPRALYELFERNEEVWNAFCRLLRGEGTFYELRSRIFGRFGWCSAPLQMLVEQFEKLKVRSALAGQPT